MGEPRWPLSAPHAALAYSFILTVVFTLYCVNRGAVDAVLCILVILACVILTGCLLIARTPPLPELQAKLVDAPLIADEPPLSRPKPRLYFLDNVKTSLTAIVVLHHVACAFSGGGWLYNIAKFRNSFQVFSATFLILNQSYFMVPHPSHFLTACKR